MQGVFFFLFLILILCFVPYPVSAEAAFDLNKLHGGLRIKLFGAFTIIRAAAEIEDKVLKIHTKKDRYLFIEIVEAAVNFLSKPQEDIAAVKNSPAVKSGTASGIWQALRFNEINLVVEQGSAENIELTVLTGGLINALGGTLFAAIKNLSPDTNVSVIHNCIESGNFRVYAKSIISVRPADIIFGIFKNYIRKRVLRKA